MDNALISIIVPAYNVSKYIDKCIWSLTHQTLSELEFIIVDDGSTDDTGLICDREAKKDSRIKLIHKENGGVSSARNTALSYCTGKYIGFVDADDIPCLNMFEIMYKAASKNDSDAAICEYKVVDSASEVLEYSGSLESCVLTSDDAIKLVTHFDKNVQVSLWNKIFKRDKIGSLCFDIQKFVSEDMEFLLKALLNCNKVSYIKAPLYGYYAQRVGSAMYHKDHAIDWYYKQSEFINETMDYVSQKRPALEKLAVSFKCGNGYMAIANALVRSNSNDTKTIKYIRYNLIKNLPLIMTSNLTAKKKLQMLVFLLNYRVYAFVMKRILN